MHSPGDEDHGLGDIDPLLVVADQASPSAHPAKGALDDPAARQGLEAFLVAAPTDDLDDEIEIASLVHELEPVVGSIGEEMLHPGPALADAVEDRLRARAVGDIGGGQVHLEPPAIGVACDMLLMGADQ